MIENTIIGLSLVLLLIRRAENHGLVRVYLEALFWIVTLYIEM